MHAWGLGEKRSSFQLETGDEESSEEAVSEVSLTGAL